MNEFHDARAFDFGAEAAARSVDYGEDLMSREKQRRELNNEAEIAECKANLKILSDERDDLRTLIRGILPSSFSARSRRWYNIIAATVLMAGGLSFTHLAFEPFGLGWQAWIYATSLAFVCAALADVVLERFGRPCVVAIAASIGFAAGLAGLVLVAHLRGDVLGLYLRTALSEGGESVRSASDAAQFYEMSIHHLQLLFSLLAVALEIATGLMIWEARRVSLAPLSEAERAKQRLAMIEPNMARLVARIVFLQNEPAIFEAEFLRDFNRGLKYGAERNGLRWMSGLAALAVGATLAQGVHGQPVTVIVPDFTRSATIARSPSGHSEHQNNLDATVNLLSRLPAATRFRVLGITEATYSRPLLILSGQIPSNPGPLEFVNRIELARTRATKQFITAAGRILVTAEKSDVIGAFFVASEIFQSAPQGERNLVFLSDMRQSATPLDIETPKVISVNAALSIVDHHHLFPDLRGADVWIIGVDAAGKDVAYVSSLREFWTAFIAKSGAHMRAFSMMRDLPDLSHPGSKGDRP
jgi:hypothetical protein